MAERESDHKVDDVDLFELKESLEQRDPGLKRSYSEFLESFSRFREMESRFKGERKQAPEMGRGLRFRT